MPKPKPDQVIRHEIAFSRPAQASLDTLSTAFAFNKVTTPLVAGLSDVSFVITMILGYLFLTGKPLETFLDLLTGEPTIQDVAAGWMDYRKTAEYVAGHDERATSVSGGLRNLIDQILAPIVGAMNPGSFFEDTMLNPNWNPSASGQGVGVGIGGDVDEEDFYSPPTNTGGSSNYTGA